VRLLPPFASKRGMAAIELLLGAAFGIVLTLAWTARLLWRPAACFAISWAITAVLGLMGIPTAPWLALLIGLLLIVFWLSQVGEAA